LANFDSKALLPQRNPATPQLFFSPTTLTRSSKTAKLRKPGFRAPRI